MGKIGGNSWFNAVKKAFRSPTKDNSKRNTRSRDEHEHGQEQEEEKERGKRRWIFKKPCVHETTIQHNEAKNIATTITTSASNPSERTSGLNTTAETANVNQIRAIAMAMATTAAAEAAVATAQAAVEIMRLTKPSIFMREHNAAIAIQTAFRGYLARKALKALKGLVKLQALVRGHNVRKRAKMTLRCMQALIRVQTQVRDQRKRLSFEGNSHSTFSEPNPNKWESYLAKRNSVSRDGSNITEEWDSHSHTVKEIESLSKITLQAALNRENTLSHAFHNQMWSSSEDQFQGNEDQEENPTWFNHIRMGRSSFHKRDPIKTVEIDTTQRYSYSSPNFPKSQNPYYHYQQTPHSHSHSHSIPSPFHRTHQNHPLSSPNTPSPIKTKPPKIHSASPRCPREKNFIASQTPTLHSNYYHRVAASGNAGTTLIPNYMAATASAKARVRSQSAPRQRPLTPEREKPVSSKKRLSFPDPYSGVNSDVDSDHNPSCKITHGRDFGVLDQRSNYSNMSYCCKEDYGDEDDNSPPTTSDVRRWLR